jgi:hypothetical protein
MIFNHVAQSNISHESALTDRGKRADSELSSAERAESAYSSKCISKKEQNLASIVWKKIICFLRYYVRLLLSDARCRSFGFTKNHGNLRGIPKISPFL